MYSNDKQVFINFSYKVDIYNGLLAKKILQCHRACTKTYSAIRARCDNGQRIIVRTFQWQLQTKPVAPAIECVTMQENLKLKEHAHSERNLQYSSTYITKIPMKYTSN